MIEKYVRYLTAVENTLIKKYFEQQKDYLHCKEGCSYCCETGQYPFSEIEFKYLMIGFNKLSDYEQVMVRNNVMRIKKNQAEFDGKEYMHVCPFLIDKKCCLYEYRGLVCRTHGLISYFIDEVGDVCQRFPYCVNLGLNYSNVYNKEKKTIFLKKWKETGIETEPVAYNLSRDALTKNDITKEMGLEFGEIKALIDWFD